jgi:tetratricopeptide (TPR) repeat protein
LAQALQTVVLFKVNAEAEDGGEELATEFTVKGYPTFVMTNAHGETINRWWGFDGTPEFLETFNEAASDPTTIAEKQARFESAPTAKDAETLGDYHLTRNESIEAVGYFEKAIEIGDPEETYEVDLVMAKTMGVRDELFTVDDVKAAADLALLSPHISESQTVEVVRWTIGLLDDEDSAAAAPYIEAGLMATEGTEDEDLQKARQRLLISQALMVTGDKELAVSLKRETMPEGWQEDAGELNGFAWWCFENEVNLEEAEALARNGAELAEDDSQKAQILDTVAEIVNLRGDTDGAIALMQRAIELAPDNDYYTEQLDRFTGAELADTAEATDTEASD